MKALLSPCLVRLPLAGFHIKFLICAVCFQDSSPNLFMKYQHHWSDSKLMETLPPNLKLTKWDHSDELVPNQGILGHVKIHMAHAHRECFKGNHFQAPNVPVFSFLNFSLWQGMYFGRPKHWSSYLPFQNCPYPVLWRKACLSLTENLIIVQCPRVHRSLGCQTKRPFEILLSTKPSLIKAPWAHGKSSCPFVFYFFVLNV